MYDSPLAQRMARYVDVRRMEGVDHQALVAFAQYFAGHSQRLAELVSGAAVVHGGGLGQVLAAGFPSLASMPYDVSLFSEPVEALTWLGCRGSARLAAELDTVQAASIGTTPVVRDVRAYCAANLREAELDGAAAALGMSSRSMQRKLHEHGTSYQRELEAARVDAAKRWLVETSSPIADIAASVGCTSAQHLTLMFRRVTGGTPSQWRASKGGG
jgi:AraC-like DNA-binding protein